MDFLSQMEILLAQVIIQGEKCLLLNFFGFGPPPPPFFFQSKNISVWMKEAE